MKGTSGLGGTALLWWRLWAGSGQISRWPHSAPLQSARGQVPEDMGPGARRPGLGSVYQLSSLRQVVLPQFHQPRSGVLWGFIGVSLHDMLAQGEPSLDSWSHLYYFYYSTDPLALRLRLSEWPVSHPHKHPWSDILNTMANYKGRKGIRALTGRHDLEHELCMELSMNFANSIVITGKSRSPWCAGV